MGNNWTDKDMMEFAEQYRYSSSRISLDIFKKSKESLRISIEDYFYIIKADWEEGYKRLKEVLDRQEELAKQKLKSL